MKIDSSCPEGKGPPCLSMLGPLRGHYGNPENVPYDLRYVYIVGVAKKRGENTCKT